MHSIFDSVLLAIYKLRKYVMTFYKEEKGNISTAYEEHFHTFRNKQNGKSKNYHKVKKLRWV